jgi:hypothetical protein
MISEVGGAMGFRVEVKLLEAVLSPVLKVHLPSDTQQMLSTI